MVDLDVLDATSVSAGLRRSVRWAQADADPAPLLDLEWLATNGVGGYASPEAGGSAYCPGLTKANGGGLQLGVCEKAVVHIQPYDYLSTTFRAPPRLRLYVE